jgi:hypothetical protein
MRDADIVHAIAKDERDGLSAAYRAYADRLYDYSLVTLDDAEAAADTVHDVFLIARGTPTHSAPGSMRSPVPNATGHCVSATAIHLPTCWTGTPPTPPCPPTIPESSSTKPSAVFPRTNAKSST